MQLQTLSWALHQESIDLNDAFWTPSPPSSSFRLVCSLTGENRVALASDLVASGGILGDAPGFGKTLIIAALLLANPHNAAVATRRNPRGADVLPSSCATLVIVKKNLLRQWEKELKKAQDNPAELRCAMSHFFAPASAF